MSGVTLDDYLIHGPKAALDVISDITGSPKIDIVGLCLGGALTAMLAAYLAETGDDRIGSVTLLNTLLDYSEPACSAPSPTSGPSHGWRRRWRAPASWRAPRWPARSTCCGRTT